MKVLLLFLAIAPAALADGTADQADLEFHLGSIEFQKGNYEGALAHFFVSNSVAPNRNVLFNIGSAYERMRRYADAHRYYFDAADGETDPAALAADQAALRRISPKVALLDVAADPPGATLYIDRKSLGSVGRAPRLLAVQPGTYSVIGESDGYESAKADGVVALLGKSTPVSLTLKRVVGQVHVRLQGAPAVTVHVDDERAPAACIAPCDLSLPPGQH
jgi:outer membrane receptor for ferrienterochelin and colicins